MRPHSMNTQGSKWMIFPIGNFFDIKEPCRVESVGQKELEQQLLDWSNTHLHYNDSTLTGGYVIPWGFERVFDYVKVTFSDEVKTIAGCGITIRQLRKEAQDFIDKFLEDEDEESNNYKYILVNFIKTCKKVLKSEKKGKLSLKVVYSKTIQMWLPGHTRMCLENMDTSLKQ